MEMKKLTFQYFSSRVANTETVIIIRPVSAFINMRRMKVLKAKEAEIKSKIKQHWANYNDKGIRRTSCKLAMVTWTSSTFVATE